MGSLLSKLNKVSKYTYFFLCPHPFQKKGHGEVAQLMPAHPCDSITSLRKPRKISKIGVGELFPSYCSPHAEKWSFCMLHAGWSISIPWRFPGSDEHIHSLVPNLFLWFAQLEHIVITLKKGREEEMRKQGQKEQERGREKKLDFVIPGLEIPFYPKYKCSLHPPTQDLNTLVPELACTCLCWVFKVKYNDNDNIVISSLSTELSWSKLNTRICLTLSLKTHNNHMCLVTIIITTSLS